MRPTLTNRIGRSAKSNKKRHYSGARGFSLIDMLISLSLGVALFAAVSEFFVKQVEFGAAQQDLARTQQNIRLGMEVLYQELQLAGLDPEGSAGAGFSEATENSVTFSRDLNGDGDILDEDESVEYNLMDQDQDGDLDLVRSSGTTLNDLVVANVESLDFLYTLDDGSSTTAPADLAAIRQVQITMTSNPWPHLLLTDGDESTPMRNIEFSRTIFLRNLASN